MGNQSTPSSAAGRRDHRNDTACWAFGPAGTEILVRNAEALLAHLPVFLAGWPFRRVGDATELEAAIDVAERFAGQFAVTVGDRGNDEAVVGNAFEAANGLAEALVATYVARSDGLAMLRAGSVQIGRGLVVLPGDSLSGPRDVALQMAAAGHRLFGDDRLAVRPARDGMGTGICLGLTSRVPLPLPPDCGARLRDYVDAFTEIRDDSMAYLKLWEGEAAGFLEEAPIAALVLLDRAAAGPSSLAPAAPADIVTALIDSYVPQRADAAAPAVALTGLASRVAGYRLRFSSDREAAATLLAGLRDRL